MQHQETGFFAALHKTAKIGGNLEVILRENAKKASKMLA